MEIPKLIDYINRAYISSDYLRAPDVYYYMDLVIDDINERLQATYPTFTDWPKFVTMWNNAITMQGPVPGEIPGMTQLRPHPMPYLMRDNTKYDAFPDKYLRDVVALGVATKYFTRDEEGEQVALDYQNRYERALFTMVRDYHIRVEPWFQNNSGGYIDFRYNREFDGPWNLVPRGVVTHGEDTKVL